MGSACLCSNDAAAAMMHKIQTLSSSHIVRSCTLRRQLRSHHDVWCRCRSRTGTLSGPSLSALSRHHRRDNHQQQSQSMHSPPSLPGALASSSSGETSECCQCAACSPSACSTSQPRSGLLGRWPAAAPPHWLTPIWPSRSPVQQPHVLFISCQYRQCVWPSHIDTAQLPLASQAPLGCLQCMLTTMPAPRTAPALMTRVAEWLHRPPRGCRHAQIQLRSVSKAGSLWSCPWAGLARIAQAIQTDHEGD